MAALEVVSAGAGWCIRLGSERRPRNQTHVTDACLSALHAAEYAYDTHPQDSGSRSHHSRTVVLHHGWRIGDSREHNKVLAQVGDEPCLVARRTAPPSINSQEPRMAMLVACRLTCIGNCSACTEVLYIHMSASRCAFWTPVALCRARARSTTTGTAAFKPPACQCLPRMPPISTAPSSPFSSTSTLSLSASSRR